jgi:predicted phage-related endonuclease
MEIINCIQGSDEWFKERLGKLTASEAQAISANGAGLKTLVNKLVAERLTGKVENGYTNADMERGKELEDEARNAYELETGNTVTKVGFCKLDEDTGSSPDGLIGENGGLEIKCYKDSSFVDYMFTQKIDTGYEWQCQFNMFVTERDWWDFAVYNPNFKKSLIIKRINRDDQAIEKIKAGIETGKAMIKAMMEKLNG